QPVPLDEPRHPLAEAADGCAQVSLHRRQRNRCRYTRLRASASGGGQSRISLLTLIGGRWENVVWHRFGHGMELARRTVQTCYGNCVKSAACLKQQLRVAWASRGSR